MSKIKYKLKKNSINLEIGRYVEQYLESVGIEDVSSFIRGPKPEDEESYTNLDNIEETIEVLYKGFKENKKFFLQCDSDVDGITSSAIFYSFFTRLFPDANIEYRLHEGKEHGVILDTVPIDADYIIIPDAGSNQFDEQEFLTNSGRIVVIIDHHNVEEGRPKFDNLFFINNQTSKNFKNKDLSGAGVVYKVIQAFNIKYKEEFKLIYEDYADLAMLGIVADMCDTRQLDNHFIIEKGRNNIKNSMLKALLEKQSFSISNITNPTKIDIAFYIAPLINAVIRFGTEEEKEGLFKGFITHESLEIVTTEYRGKERTETIYEYIARLAFNTRGRQNREKNKSMEFLSNKIEDNNLQENQIVIVIASKDDEVTVPQTITGLVAMELLKKYQRPTLVLRPKVGPGGEPYYAGSGRGKENGEFTSFSGFLEESGLCEYAQGHDMAFGASVSKENLPKLIEYANEKLKDIDFGTDEFEVDHIFEGLNINTEMILQFGRYNHLYGNGIPQPKFAFKMRIPASQIGAIGGDKSTVRVTHRGLTFIKFKDKELAENLENIKTHLVDLEIVGRAQLNEWMGNVSPQIIIDAISYKEVELENLF